MSGPLHLDVFVVPYKPIVGLIAPMGAGEATWPATAVSLISGERDAVLVDAVLTPEDAGRVVDWIRGDRKEPDDDLHHPRPWRSLLWPEHDPGRVPQRPRCDRGGRRSRRTQTAQSGADGVLERHSRVKIPERPIVPDALDGDVLDLEGQQLRIITVGQSDTYPMSTEAAAESLLRTVVRPPAARGRPARRRRLPAVPGGPR